jgi:multicomponent K+:H+ antiporter subunit D
VNHWIIAPVALPALVAPFILMAARFDLPLQRTLSIASTAILAAIAAGLYALASDGQVRPYLLGDWPAPFGIVLVLDRLSALMVLVASWLALAVALYAVHRWDGRGPHFHVLFQFQLMGLNGAFLTGDVFNLFVFFEVLLIASYGLLLHGAGAQRIVAGVQYVAVNLTGSTLFLVAVGLIYSVTGTLNMADLAVKVPLVPEADRAILHAGALLLLVVFCLKAALVPLHLWLPRTYGAATAPVAALFAVMTKVGAYAILRVHVLVFGAGAGDAAWIAAPWVLPAALATMALGMAGVLAARSLTGLACFAIVGSMGNLLVAVGLFAEGAAAAALYYLVHSTVAAAALFLLADLVAARRGGLRCDCVAGPRFADSDLLAGLFFLAAIAFVGMPPLSGFVGKVLILEAARAHPWWGLIWALLLGTSLLALVGFARAGSTVFWKSAPAEGAEPPTPARGGPALPLVAASALVAATVLLAAFAGPVTDRMAATARQMFEPAAYVDAVLGPRPALAVGRAER